MKKIIRSLIICILLCIIGISSYLFLHTLYQYQNAEQTEDEIQNTFIKDTSEPSEQTDTWPELDIDIQSLINKNEDFSFWLYFKDGNINLPVVQEKPDEINYYMDHNFYRKSSAAGCPFLSYDIKDDLTITNTIIYGHNMKNGTTFGTLKNLYRNPETLTDPYFYIYTKDQKLIQYRVLSIYIDDKNTELYRIPKDNAEQKDYIQDILKKNNTVTTFPLTETEQNAINDNNPIVTLYTCYGNTGSDIRLFIQGIQTEQRSI